MHRVVANLLGKLYFQFQFGEGFAAEHSLLISATLTGIYSGFHGYNDASWTQGQQLLKSSLAWQKAAEDSLLYI